MLNHYLLPSVGYHFGIAYWILSTCRWYYNMSPKKWDSRNLEYLVQVYICCNEI